MPKIKINDIHMYYEIHGKGDPIVLVAGFSADHLGWLPIVDKFSEHYQVILFDNRGAGQSDIPSGPYSISQMTKDVVDLCAALNIQQAHFVGNSMGGCIVQALCYQFPQLVKSAVISNSAMRTDTPFYLYVKAHMELLSANAPLELLMKAMCTWVFSYKFLCLPNMIETLIKIAKENPYPMTMQGYQSQYVALGEFDSTDWVHKINVPTLIITSNQDLIFSEKSSEHLSKVIKQSEYFCFKDCGHLPYIEQPEKFTEVVMEFLRK